MDVQRYLGEFMELQKHILEFLDSENNCDANYAKLTKLFNDLKIRENQHYLKSLLILLLNISNNHHRTHDFFIKIEQIIVYFKEQIKQNFQNFEIFRIFASNQRIILSLLEQEIIVFDELIFKYIIKEIEYKKILAFDWLDDEDKTPEFYYFQPELQQYDDSFSTEELDENFNEKRKIGENDSYICELIRNDSIIDFIQYIHKSNYDLNGEIRESVFETNPFLIEKKTTMIEYAAFFGSIQIVQYLLNNDVRTNHCLLDYAIHSNNPELIYLISDHYPFSYVSFETSIKCHHNSVANYVKNQIDSSLIQQKNCLKYHNFEFIDENIQFDTILFTLCEYDYYIIVENILKTKDIDVNVIETFTKDDHNYSEVETNILILF